METKKKAIKAYSLTMINTDSSIYLYHNSKKLENNGSLHSRLDFAPFCEQNPAWQEDFARV